MQIYDDRIPVIIGKNGVTKKLIEEKTGTLIHIESKTGICEISVKDNNVIKNNELTGIEDDPDEILPDDIKTYIAKNVIDAINHGFNPQKALKLIFDEFTLDIVNLEGVLGSNKKRLQSMKGRIIGKNGFVRNEIEKSSGTFISVYDKYVSIIGDFDGIRTVKGALNMIFDGLPHNPIIRYLHEEYEKRKQKQFTTLWKPSI